MKSKKELIKKGCRILAIDGYNDKDVIPLEVKRVKECLKVIIEQSRIKGN